MNLDMVVPSANVKRDLKKKRKPGKKSLQEKEKVPRRAVKCSKKVIDIVQFNLDRLNQRSDSEESGPDHVVRQNEHVAIVKKNLGGQRHVRKQTECADEKSLEENHEIVYDAGEKPVFITVPFGPQYNADINNLNPVNPWKKIRT